MKPLDAPRTEAELNAIMPADVLPLRPELERGSRLTDIGNGERFADQHSDRVRYCHQWRSWLIWDTRRWARDTRGSVIELAKETTRQLYIEAGREPNAAKRAALVRHAAHSEGDSRLRAMLTLARSDRSIAVGPEEFDADPFLLNLEDCVIDLRFGRPLDHAPEQLITKLAGATFVRGQTCPTWLRFLDRVLSGNAELIAFIQRAVGYTLTGDTGAQCLFFLYGTGANGKSTFLDAVAMLLGEYAREADFSTFLERRGEGAREDIARLQGARMVRATEASAGRRWNEGLLKTLTGQDTVVARFLHQNSFEFQPQFKLWVAANHKPRVGGVDDAIWRRIMLIPFTIQIPETERTDKTLLLEQLRQELPGILQWALKGCAAWLKNGLQPPATVRNATAEYREDQDTLGAFFADYCALGADFRAPTAALYQAYSRWCEDGHERPMTQNMFGRVLTDRGFVPIASGDGNTRMRKGLRLKPTSSPDAFRDRREFSSDHSSRKGDSGEKRQNPSGHDHGAV